MGSHGAGEVTIVADSADSAVRVVELLAPIVSCFAQRRSALFGGPSGHPFSEMAKVFFWQKPGNSADMSPGMCCSSFRSLTSLSFVRRRALCVHVQHMIYSRLRDKS